MLGIGGLSWAIVAPNFVRSGPGPNSGCIANLKQIAGAAQQWAVERNLPNNALVNWAEVPHYLKGSQLPRCPKKGTYTLGKTVSDLPRCTVPGHTL